MPSNTSRGCLSDLDSKDVESIAYLHDRERQGLQKFIGQAEWNHRPMVDELVRQVAAELGEADGVLVFDPSAFAKKGTESVGVQRQWCGRLGKIENCQVGIYLGYVSRREHALVDFRLLPAEGVGEEQAAAEEGRRARGGSLPHAARIDAGDARRTRSAVLPHAWIAGDDELGRSSWFREELRQREERYLLAVPSNTLVRDLKAPEPPSERSGPAAAGAVRACGPLVRGVAGDGLANHRSPRRRERTAGGAGGLDVGAGRTAKARSSDVAECLVVFRERQGDGTWKHDYLLSNAWRWTRR